MIDEKYPNDYEVISNEIRRRKDYNAKIKALKLSITNDKKSKNALNIKNLWWFRFHLKALNKAYKRLQSTL